METKSGRGRRWAGTAACAAVLATAGCAGTIPTMGGVTPGVLFTGGYGPGQLPPDTLYMTHPERFRSKGWVEGKASRWNLLGIFAVGDGGYRAALDNAEERADADAVVNCVGDVQMTSLLVLFASSTTTVRCVAVDEVKHDGPPVLPEEFIGEEDDEEDE